MQTQLEQKGIQFLSYTEIEPVMQQIASESLRFPEANTEPTTPGFGYVEAAGLSAPLFAADGCLVVSIGVNWRSLSMHTSGPERRHVLGNATHAEATASAGRMALSIIGQQSRTGLGDVDKVALAFRGASGVFSAELGLAAADAVGPDRVWLRVESVGGTVRLEAWADGTKIASATDYAAGTQTPGGLALAGSGLLVGLTGGAGSLNPGLGAGFGGGMVGFVGYHEGALPDAAMAAISAGGAVEAETAAGDWRFARVLSDHQATGIAAAQWASADAGAPWPVKGAGPLEPGSSLAPATGGAGSRLAIDEPADGTVWAVGVNGQARGDHKTSAPVRLTGTAAGLSGGLEVRFVTAAGAEIHGWTAMTGPDLAGGTVDHTADLGLFAEGWGFAEVRPAGSPAVVFRSRRKCGVGFAFGLFDQSPLGTALARDVANTNRLPALAANVSWAINDMIGTGFSPKQGGGRGRVLCGTPDRAWYDTLASFMEVWGEITDIPCCMATHLANGQSYVSLMNDGDTSRLWTDVIELALPHGSRLTKAWEGWNQGPDIYYDGAAAGFDHHIFDGTPYNTDGGVLMLATSGYADFDNPVTHDRQWSVDGTTGAQNYGRVGNTLSITAQAGRRVALANGWFYGMDRFDVVRDGSHVASGDRESRERVAKRVIYSFAASLGLASADVPRIMVDEITVSPDERTILVPVSLPNGGDLVTHNVLTGAVTLDADKRWVGGATGRTYGEVMGFEIREPGQADANEWLGPTPAATNDFFTAWISDTGSGTGTSRRGVVSIAKDDASPWGRGTELNYVTGLLIAHGSPFTDDRAHDSTLSEHLPGTPHGTLCTKGLLVAAGDCGYTTIPTHRIDAPSIAAAQFASGEQGDLWLIDPARLWKDAARTQPVTADGDIVMAWDGEIAGTVLRSWSAGGFNPLIYRAATAEYGPHLDWAHPALLYFEDPGWEEAEWQVAIAGSNANSRNRYGRRTTLALPEAFNSYYGFGGSGGRIIRFFDESAKTGGLNTAADEINAQVVHVRFAEAAMPDQIGGSFGRYRNTYFGPPSYSPWPIQIDGATDVGYTAVVRTEAAGDRGKCFGVLGRNALITPDRSMELFWRDQMGKPNGFDPAPEPIHFQLQV